MKTSSMAIAMLLTLLISAPLLADSGAMDAKDAELQMLRSAVKRQADELAPLQALVKAQTMEIQKLTAELANLRSAAHDADQFKTQLALTAKAFEDTKEVLAAHDNRLSEANAKLQANKLASGKAAPIGGNIDPVRAEFIASFQKFASQFRPAFITEYDKEIRHRSETIEKDARVRALENEYGDAFNLELGGKITNFKSDVISTDSAINPLIGVVTVPCYTDYSAHYSTTERDYKSSHKESLVITMHFIRVNGYWKLADATRRTVEITGNGNLGFVGENEYDRSVGSEVDFSQAPLIQAAVIDAHGLLP